MTRLFGQAVAVAVSCVPAAAVEFVRGGHGWLVSGRSEGPDECPCPLTSQPWVRAAAWSVRPAKRPCHGASALQTRHSGGCSKAEGGVRYSRAVSMVGKAFTRQRGHTSIRLLDPAQGTLGSLQREGRPAIRDWHERG